MCPRGASGAQAEYLCIAETSAVAIMPKDTPLDAIAEAYRYVQTGQKTGIVVIEI